MLCSILSSPLYAYLVLIQDFFVYLCGTALAYADAQVGSGFRFCFILQTKYTLFTFMSKKKRLYHSNKKPKGKTKIIRQLLNLFKKSVGGVLKQQEIVSNIGINSGEERQLLSAVMQMLLREGTLEEVSKGVFRLAPKGTILQGRFERRHNGKNFFIPNDGSPMVFIAERNAAHAMNGDEVRIQLLAHRKGKDPEGAVLEILERKQTQFVGVLQMQKHYAFLISDSKVLANDIFIAKEHTAGASHGDKVIVEVIEWPLSAKNPIGKVVDILGKPGENTTEMHAILAEFGLPYKYPLNVEKAAKRISDQIPAQEIAQREDLRDVTTFTIDPQDAKDFDDALSVRQLPNGHIEVGVHIADVTHYVKEHSVIDKEAKKRATSVYLVDRTVPMLPERLSNELCSLRPHEDKCCFSCIFELDEKAHLHQYRIVRTVIHSNRRFTYEEAQQIIETGEGEYANEIKTLNRIAQKLRSKRFERGAIAFDRHEVKFKLDKEGTPIGVYFKVAKEANKLVEEFMLLANKTVAEFVGKVSKNKNAKTFVYRVHDQPDASKLQSLSEFILKFGHRIKTKGGPTTVSKSINKLLGSVQDRPEENLISTIAIRSMAKATYTTDNIGHYGLAFPYYTHFTSPIRRYPDMMVHRLLERYIKGGRSVTKDKVEELCKHCSDMEQVASNAERASIKYKQVEYLSDKLGEVFDGVISGVTEWGIYVEIKENMCEGMIPVRELDDDFYELDEKNYCLRGKRRGSEYRLGDEIRIKVVRANLERRLLDFAPC